MKDGNDYKEWDTVRSVCGKARLTYHFEWSVSKPWCSFRNGTTGLHFETLYQGINYMESFGYTFEYPIKIT